MGGKAIETLLDALGERGARGVLAECGTRAALREFDRQCAIRQAVSLLRHRVHRSVIRERLMVGYGYSWTTAYRVINLALSELFQNSVCDETQGVDD